jgi:hypothetical protein
MKNTKGDRKNPKGKTRVRFRRLPRVPPPDSSVWPEQYRGRRWKPIYAILFARKCQLCAYSFPPSKWRQGMDQCLGLTRLLLCTNHPRGPGELREVLPIETCRNFKPKRWTRRPTVPALDRSHPPCDKSDPTVRRIILSNGMIATVDAADYKRLSQYQWYANRHGHKVYACAKIRGKTVCMHRMILRPRQGYVVDHIDGNGLNIRCHIPRSIFTTPLYTIAYERSKNLSVSKYNLDYNQHAMYDLVALHRCSLIVVEGISHDRTRSQEKDPC